MFADPWPGTGRDLAFARRLELSSARRSRLRPSIVGETLDPTCRAARPAASTARNRVRVRLYGGALASVSDSALLGGANAAAVRRPDGAWEVLQFANAELVGERTYELSRLLRGQAGSEWAMGDPLPAGAPFVLLDAACGRRSRAASMRSSAPMQLRIVAAERDHGDPAAVALDATPQRDRAAAARAGASARAPHRRRRDAVTGSGARGSTATSGARRGAARRGARSLRGRHARRRDVVRTLSDATPSVLYAAADEIADFGAPQASLAVRVAQLSATVGRGFAASDDPVTPLSEPT